MSENSKPLTMEEQWERYQRMMAHYKEQMAAYRAGKRPTVPPRPIMPHTPGFRGANDA